MRSKVRKFRDSVERPGEFIFGFVVMEIFAVAIPVVAALEGTGDSYRGLVLTFVVGLPVILNAFILLTVMSVRRAHASKTWRKVAKLLVRNGYLRK